MEKPATHYFNIEMQIEKVPDDIIQIKTVVWTPGSYLVREYAKNIDAVIAKDKNGNNLLVKKIDKNTWEVACNKKDFSVYYNYYAFEESVRTSYLDDKHASIIPASLFMYLPKYDVSSTIHYHPYAGWEQISTSLEMINNDKWIRTAPNKDILFDSPVEIGNHVIINFTVAGVEHELAMYGEGNYNLEKIKNDFTKIIEEQKSMWEEHPCKRYVIFVQNSNKGGGGLEHLNSTSLITQRFNYEPENNYRGFISLFSHEYFHLWNVKRLRPEPLGPFNYDAENYTTSLWIAEGFTAYYDDLFIRRTQLMTPNDYLTVVEGNINATTNRAGDFIQSVAEASFDAWIKYYRPNENSPNAQVDYYTKGATLAMILDLEILNNSKGEYRLDDVMRYMYNEYYKKLNRAYSEAEMKTAIEKFAGKDMTLFYTDHVHGTKPIDYKKYFSYAGLNISDANVGNKDIDLGATISATNTITAVRGNSSAENAGLNVNDEVIAINGFRFTNNLNTLLIGKKEGDTIEVTVSRNGMLQNFTISLEYNKKVNYQLTLNSDATVEQKELYKKWMKAESFN
ncbi:MAG: M61 family metallopeptidase [Fimbriimonadaceae bacterium]|nr:M61 family metallopeptidase [Chitinophagales bacterium]